MSNTEQRGGAPAESETEIPASSREADKVSRVLVVGSAALAAIANVESLVGAQTMSVVTLRAAGAAAVGAGIAWVASRFYESRGQ